MRVKRSRLEIYFRIMESLSTEGLNMTHTMYRANLSYYQARRYLDFLLQRGLINKVQEKGKVTYRITEKGKILLKHFRPIKRELKLP